jgi:uncharacterized integral membrane protein
MERFKNPKLIGALVLVALAVIVFYQNRQPVELRVLILGSLSTRLATALSLAFLAGLVTGFLAFSRWQHTKQKQKRAQETGVA